MNHFLKTLPEYFRAVKSGVKTFEVRKNDRNYRVGDTLILIEHDPLAERMRDGTIERTVVYLLEGGQFGIEKGYCVMGLSAPEEIK